MEHQEYLEVERLGGFGGFGLPGSHLKSRGDVAISGLSAADLQVIDRLFQGTVSLVTPKTDGFRYRLKRITGYTVQTIEVPEENVPISIRNSVKDTLE